MKERNRCQTIVACSDSYLLNTLHSHFSNWTSLSLPRALYIAPLRISFLSTKIVCNQITKFFFFSFSNPINKNLTNPWSKVNSFLINSLLFFFFQLHQSLNSPSQEQERWREDTEKHGIRHQNHYQLLVPEKVLQWRIRRRLMMTTTTATWMMSFLLFLATRFDLLRWLK